MSRVPPALIADRSQAIHRVLGRLPGEFLAALIEGVEAADVIVTGRLFAGRSGGCAVGVALRALDPAQRGRRAPWGRRRSVTALQPELAKRIAHLRALEDVFDRSVKLALGRRPHACTRVVAREIADWIAAEAREELLRREVKAEWLDALEQRVEQQELARGLAELEHELVDLEPRLERELAELLHDWALPA